MRYWIMYNELEYRNYIIKATSYYEAYDKALSITCGADFFTLCDEPITKNQMEFLNCLLID